MRSLVSKPQGGQAYVASVVEGCFHVKGSCFLWEISSSLPEMLRMLSSGIVGRSSGRQPRMISSLCLLLDGIMHGIVDFLLLAMAVH